MDSSRRNPTTLICIFCGIFVGIWGCCFAGKCTLLITRRKTDFPEAQTQPFNLYRVKILNAKQSGHHRLFECKIERESSFGFVVGIRSDRALLNNLWIRLFVCVRGSPFAVNVVLFGNIYRIFFYM